MFECIHKIIPETVMPLTLVRSVSQTITRQSNDYYIPVSRTNLGNRALTKSCPKVWNSLPREVKETGTLATFKTKLKKYFFSIQ